MRGISGRRAQGTRGQRWRRWEGGRGWREKREGLQNIRRLKERATGGRWWYSGEHNALLTRQCVLTLHVSDDVGAVFTVQGFHLRQHTTLESRRAAISNTNNT